MKFFHISDLHLGKKVNEFSMIKDQEFILKKILTEIKNEKPDGLIVAGDVFDRNVPSEEAMKLWDDFLIRLAEMNMPVFAISGNHDSAVRFADHGALVETTGIHLAPKYNGEIKSYTLEDEHGELNIYLLPFVRPADVRKDFPDEEIVTYTDALRVAIDNAGVDKSKRNVIVAHQFVTGAKTSEGDEVSVGGIDNVDADVFDSFDYVALGHIHSKQTIGKETIRYCGTPLRYAFSDKSSFKSITVVELKAKGDVRISEIELEPLHEMREIKGTYDELTLKENYENTQTDDYIHAVLTDENDVIDAINKLRIIYPNIMRLSYDNVRTQKQQEIGEVQDVESKSPVELFGELYERQNNQELSGEQLELVQDCIDRIWKEKV